MLDIFILGFFTSCLVYYTFRKFNKLTDEIDLTFLFIRYALQALRFVNYFANATLHYMKQFKNEDLVIDLENSSNSQTNNGIELAKKLNKDVTNSDSDQKNKVKKIKIDFNFSTNASSIESPVVISSGINSNLNSACRRQNGNVLSNFRGSPSKSPERRRSERDVSVYIDSLELKKTTSRKSYEDSDTTTCSVENFLVKEKALEKSLKKSIKKSHKNKRFEFENDDIKADFMC